MTVRIPVGEAEGTRLEFKSAEALRRPERIAREVVAMLNAAGGEVWVGLRDEGGVAMEIEPIDQPEEEGARLFDALVDRIVPPPAGDEVLVEVVGETPARILRVTARPPQVRRPYAVRGRDASLQFSIRTGPRNRPLTWDEVQTLFLSQAAEEVAEKRTVHKSRLQQDLEQRVEANGELLWIGVSLPTAGVLDLDAVAEGEYLVDPASIGGVGSGLSYLNTFYAAYFLAQREGARYLRPSGDGWLEVGAGEYRLRLGRQAELRAEAPLEKFLGPPVDPHRTRFPEMASRQILDPKPLVAYPLSVMRMMSALLRDPRLWSEPVPESGEGKAIVALIGVEGWFLFPGPDHPLRTSWIDPLRLRVPEPELRERPTPAAWDTIPEYRDPVSLSIADLRNEPDRCALRLLRGIFAAFGFHADQIPYYDRRTGRFAL